MSVPIWSSHALERYRSRFPGIDLEKALSEARRPNKKERRDGGIGMAQPGTRILVNIPVGVAFIIEKARAEDQVVTVIKYGLDSGH